MTFTNDPETDIGKVRLYVGDRTELNDSAGNPTDSGIRSDEEIQAFIDIEGSWEKATVAWTVSWINQLNTEPDSTTDWLEISLESAREQAIIMLSKLEAWLGVSGAGNTTRSVPAWRGDSKQTKAPDNW